MKKKYTKKEVLNKIVQKLNKEGFKKESLHEVGKEELKKILREIYDVIKIYIDKKEKSQQIKVDEKKNTEKKINDLKDDMKQKIKDNSHMTNNEFLMLLHLMRLKKETVYESNPYIVDFSVTLESVYQSENAEDEGDGDNYLFSKFESDLNKYVD